MDDDHSAFRERFEAAQKRAGTWKPPMPSSGKAGAPQQNNKRERDLAATLGVLRKSRVKPGRTAPLPDVFAKERKRYRKIELKCARAFAAWMAIIPEYLRNHITSLSYQRGNIVVGFDQPAVHYEIRMLVRAGGLQQLLEESGFAVKDVKFKFHTPRTEDPEREPEDFEPAPDQGRKAVGYVPTSDEARRYVMTHDNKYHDWTLEDIIRHDPEWMDDFGNRQADGDAELFEAVKAVIYWYYHEREDR